MPHACYRSLSISRLQNPGFLAKSLSARASTRLLLCMPCVTTDHQRKHQDASVSSFLRSMEAFSNCLLSLGLITAYSSKYKSSVSKRLFSLRRNWSNISFSASSSSTAIAEGHPDGENKMREKERSLSLSAPSISYGGCILRLRQTKFQQQQQQASKVTMASILLPASTSSRRRRSAITRRLRTPNPTNHGKQPQSSMSTVSKLQQVLALILVSTTVMSNAAAATAGTCSSTSSSSSSFFNYEVEKRVLERINDFMTYPIIATGFQSKYRSNRGFSHNISAQDRNEYFKVSYSLLQELKVDMVYFHSICRMIFVSLLQLKISLHMCLLRLCECDFFFFFFNAI